MGILRKLTATVRGSTTSNSDVQNNDQRSIEISTDYAEIDELFENLRSDQIDIRRRGWVELTTIALENPTVLSPSIGELLSVLGQGNEYSLEEIAAIVGLLAERVPDEFDQHAELMVSCLDHPNKYVRESLAAGLTNIATVSIPLDPLLTGLKTESRYAEEATIVLARIATENPDRLPVDELIDLRETGPRSLAVRIGYLLLLLDPDEDYEAVDIGEVVRSGDDNFLPSHLVTRFKKQLVERFLEQSTPLDRDTDINVAKTAAGVSVVLKTDVSRHVDVSQIETYLANQLGLKNPTVSVEKV